MKHRLPFLLLAPLVLLACDDPQPVEDAHVPMVDAGPQLEASELFGPCVEDWQCPGAGAVCRPPSEGYPQGFCTVPCEDRTPCDAFNVYHHCVVPEGETQGFCEQRCLNGIDCGRDAYTCGAELPPSGGVCLAVCSDDEQCGDGTVCDRYTGRCVDGAPAEGADTGEPCDFPDDCRSGLCATEMDANRIPTGWVQGYCSGNCILPSGFNNNDFFAGDTLPSGTCPGDAVCLPSQGQSRGDLGTCYDECETDADCRTGYGCLNAIQLNSGQVARFTNGACVPADCGSSPCPSGYQCVTVNSQSGARNVCVRQ